MADEIYILEKPEGGTLASCFDCHADGLASCSTGTIKMRQLIDDTPDWLLREQWAGSRADQLRAAWTKYVEEAVHNALAAKDLLDEFNRRVEALSPPDTLPE